MRNFNFVGNLKKCLMISAALFALIVVGMFVFGINLDIEFRGGSIITYSYDGDVDLGSFQKVANDATGTDTSAQKSENIVTGQQTIIISLPGNQSLSVEAMESVTESLRTEFPDNNIQTMEISNVNPTIGSEFLFKCLVAMAVASVFMIIYIAFRFRKIGGMSAGVASVLALIHDVIIAFGVFVLFRIPLNNNFLVVVLTILGFSINDTIVVYDRIRENQRLLPRSTSITEITNISINQSLKRTIVTTVIGNIALIVVSIVAIIFSVDTIQSFAFPLIIGLTSGLYSSLCLAGPMWVWWQERKAIAK